MKYPGKSSPQRTLIIVGACLLVLLGIAAAWNTFMGDRYDWSGMMGFGGTSATSSGSVMMDSYYGDDGAYATKSGIALSAAPEESRAGAETTEAKIIRTGNLTMSVDGVNATVSAITNVAASVDGYVQSSQISEDIYGNLSGWMTIRVPEATFDNVMAQVKAMAVHLESESSDTVDVTQTYTDLAARLTAAKAQEAQYLLILEDATTVGEVLAVEEHLADVRATIESLQGQIDYLGNQTSYSTINVSLSEETRITIPSEKFDIVREMKQAAHFVVVLGQQLIMSLVWLVIVGVGIGAPLALLGWLIWKLVKKLRK